MSVTAPKGFVANGVHAGIRRQKLDLSIVRSVEPCVGTGMFTVNRVQAAIGSDVSPSTLEATDARRVCFDALHERSTTLMQINLVGTLVLLAWFARDGRSHDRA